ncbi:hypothetical protein IG193_01470 [Infirmifilum lucidum]|uniref:4-vinyl reductase 4VR domain-containing protein n=1 Tax=Infirmifilum lucidum TaxID=2776706 RepID=A0A7L9FH47_9CREN|nr:4-vinyl reductase [Infirmifilum lucidum]QOJ79158.1 hypothetical protein IG193_01470 [Infirmifilum lucidum]
MLSRFKGLMSYELGRIFILPSTSTYMFRIVYSEEALLARGVLIECLECFSRNNVPILTLHVSWNEETRELWAFVVADVPDSSTARRVTDCLSRVNMVRRAEFAPPISNGVSADPWGYPPLLGGQRSVIMRGEVLSKFLLAGWSQLGTGFGSILYYTFFEAGASAYRDFYSKLLKRREDIAVLAARAFTLMGYGVLEILEWSDEKFVARVHDNVECKALAGIEEAESMMIRGMLAGFVAASWGVGMRDVLPSETKCVKRGDPYCEFVITRR